MDRLESARNRLRALGYEMYGRSDLFVKTGRPDRWLEFDFPNMQVTKEDPITVEEMAACINYLTEYKLMSEEWNGTHNEERCVCCGAPIPEGRQVCPQCERKAEQDG